MRLPFARRLSHDVSPSPLGINGGPDASRSGNSASNSGTERVVPRFSPSNEKNSSQSFRRLNQLYTQGNTKLTSYLTSPISAVVSLTEKRQASERMKTSDVRSESNGDVDESFGAPTPIDISTESRNQHERPLLLKGPSRRLSVRSRQSRRTRNSLRATLDRSDGGDNQQRVKLSGMGYLQLRAASLPLCISNRDENNVAENPIVSALLESLKKIHLCDVKLLGRDGVTVNAPGYLLAVNSSIIEGMLYPTAQSEPTSIHEDRSEKKQAIAVPSVSSTRKIDIPFADEPAISASVHFLASQNLPTSLDIRTICKVYLIGKLFRINLLADEAYRKGRIMINKLPCLACAAFDESTGSEREGEEHDWWGLSFGYGNHELGAYALECLLDAPVKTFLRGGTKFLRVESMGIILGNRDMDTDELTIFQILRSWVKEADGSHEEKVLAARSLVRHIDFSLISPSALKHQVECCEFVEKSHVDAALQEIELRLSNRSPDELEHVVVSGAGNPNVNGIYVRMEEDIGLDADDILFVKEAEEYENCPDFGLFRHRNMWTIACCTDYSNALYFCEVESDNKTSNRGITPMLGWRVASGSEPAPECHWFASKDEKKRIGSGDAPNLEDYYKDNRANDCSTSHDMDNSEFALMMCFTHFSCVSEQCT